MPEFELGGDTIAAVATPAGTGAIGMIRVSGPRAISLAGSLIALANGQPLDTLPARRCMSGIFHQNGTRVDQGMVTLFRAPRSYTGEDVVEIALHGSPAVLKRALEILVRAGARLAEPGEFSQRAFLNGKMDLAQAEAVAELIRSQTELARQAAFAQLEGQLSKTVRGIKSALLRALSHIEVRIDHSDDPTAGAALGARDLASEIKSADLDLERLVKSYDYGRIALNGIRIAIVGKPNAGKSSLLNILLRNERAIVTDLPGTTRDTLEERFDLLGFPAVLVDTAGVRGHAADLAEKIGMERTLKAMESADALMVVLDRSRSLSDEDDQVAELVRGFSKIKKVFCALNKSDLPVLIDEQKVRVLLPDAVCARVSAREGTGLDDLMRMIHESFALDAGDSEENGFATVISLRHCNLARSARAGLARALKLIEENGPEECLALELRDSAESLGAILGESVNDDVLKEIFANFCIGK